MLSLVVVGCNLNYHRGGASIHPYFDTHFVVCTHVFLVNGLVMTDIVLIILAYECWMDGQNAVG